MDLPAPGTPPERMEGSILRALALHFVANGITFRALMELEHTPKPWSPQVRSARRLFMQASGIRRDAWEELSDALQKAVISTWRRETSGGPDKVVGTDTPLDEYPGS